MAGPLRLEFAGALYHVTARGNERRSIFPKDADAGRAAFLDVLAATCARFNWIVHAYCLMQARIDPKRPLREVPKRQCRPLAKPLADYAARYSDRDRAIAEAYRSGAYSMQAIGDHFGVSRLTVSRAVRRREGAAADGVTCAT